MEFNNVLRAYKGMIIGPGTNQDIVQSPSDVLMDCEFGSFGDPKKQQLICKITEYRYKKILKS